MSRRDYRCCVSGVSLLDAETAVVLLQQRRDEWQPASLPLWGRYEGTGGLVDVQEGPNAELLLSHFERERREGRLHIDWEAMGLVEQPVDHIETLISVLVCSHLSGDDAVKASGGALGCGFVSAHVLAALMDGDPEIPSEVTVEALPVAALDGEWGRAAYLRLSELPIKLRCRFGISLAGMIALAQEMKRREIAWAPPGGGIEEEAAEPALWMAQALVQFAESEPLVEALEEYSGQGDEELTPD